MSSNTPLTDSKTIESWDVVPADFARALEKILRDVVAGKFPNAWKKEKEYWRYPTFAPGSVRRAQEYISKELEKLEAGK